MLNRRKGLTATYNRFHNPEESAADIVKLRELHMQMDQAVAAAYGWSDLALGHAFHKTAQGVRFTISEVARREVLGRLLALNHSRYEEEVKMGLHAKKAKAKAESKGKKRGGGEAGERGRDTGMVSGWQGSLPGLEDDRPRQLGLFGEEA
jgi:Fe-S cluster assembly scaffold protein SufB